MIKQLLFLTLFILPFFSLSQSTIDNISFQADSMSRDSKTKEITLKGDIKILLKGKNLTADKVTINTEKKIITATGNASLTDDSSYIEANEILYFYKEKKAQFKDAYIQYGNVLFQGSEIEQLSDKTYLIKDAFYTACTTCPYSWAFRGDSITAEVGGYAKIDSPKLDLYGLNLLILPQLWVPLKTQRQTGLLSPKIEYSNTGGFTYGQSFFWAISRSQDITTTLKIYEKRAPMTSFDYRYVLSSKSHGNFDGGYIYDPDNEWQATPNRYFLRYQHEFLLPYDIENITKLNYISDLKMPTDFPNEVRGHGDPYKESFISFTKNINPIHINLSSKIFLNLLKENPEARNKDAVHKLPSLEVSNAVTSLLGSPLNYSLALNYDHFYRIVSHVDRVGTDSAQLVLDKNDFDPSTDIMRTGQRFFFSPSLSFPLHLGPYFDVLPKIQQTSAFYFFNTPDREDIQNFSSFTNRSYLNSTISLRTQLNGIFKGQDYSIKHSVEPEISLQQVDLLTPTRHPFFGPLDEQSDLTEDEVLAQENIFNTKNEKDVQFDYYDRVFNKSVINLSLLQKWIKKQNNHYHQMASLLISQAYDINELEKASPQPWSILKTKLTVNFDLFETYTAASYYPYADIANTTSRIRFKDTQGNFFESVYTVNHVIDKDNTFDYDNRTENLTFGLGWKHRYFTVTGRIDYSLVTNDILSWEYDAYIYPPGDCWSLNLRHKQFIRGDTLINLGVEFQFQGS